MKNSNGTNDKAKKSGVTFDENMFPHYENEDKLNVSAVRPFTKYRAIEMILCAAAVVIGLLYLYTSLISLTLLLPLFSVGMVVITLMRFLDVRKTSGGTKSAGKLITMIPVIFSAILTVIIIVVTLAYFRGM